jgi:nitrite reductase/ring-hydroxylating ferredoxin subunit
MQTSARNGPHTVRAGSAERLRDGCLLVQGSRHGIVVFLHDGRPHAVDNRCPHLGFPLARGTVKDGILTCHWHHWRFDLQTGGCFTSGGEDVRVYPAWIEDGEVLVDVGPGEAGTAEALARARGELRSALEQASTLRAAKAVLRLRRNGGSRHEVLLEAALFGARCRQDWSTGMTVLTAMANLLELLGPLPEELELLALVHGLREVASSCQGRPPRRALKPLQTEGRPAPERLESWFRMFVEERSEAGAERCLLSALEAGWDKRRVAGLLYAAATDHFFLDEGHTIDFMNKAFELLDHVGWSAAPQILPLLVPPLCTAKRYEEDTEWRYPFDFVKRLHESFESVDRRVEKGRGRTWQGEAELVEALQSDRPEAGPDALDRALGEGATAEALGRAVALAAAYRLARYNLRNEVFDWETMHHAFTTAYAVCEAARLAPPEAILRGIYHSAVKLYLVRFLTLPPARLPGELNRKTQGTPEELLRRMSEAVGTKRVTDAAVALGAYLDAGSRRERLDQALLEALLREDAGFHEFQNLEAGLRLARRLDPRQALVPLVGAIRFLAAHSPTDRFVSATVDKALRLERGEDLAAEEPASPGAE